ncbi:MAG: OmpA family protein, partial [Gammaproteobacteria bacterium]|nr:OmpA family protein [Gammaproteobacteria bacterium]
VPYTITLRNTLGGVLQNMAMFDQLPPGFKYVEGSGRFNGNPLEPVISANARQLQWDNLDIIFDQTYTFQLLLVVGSGVSEGEYVNRAWAQDSTTGSVSDIATATVRVVPDPAMDCSDVIGKVFDDRNLNGYQDEGEPGITGARVVTARGLLVTTDEHGRFHVTCAVVPNEDRGSNFILKLDERTLPTGYRVTTENPRVQRVTRGKMSRFNFGATVHHVVTLSVADGAFTSKTAEIRPQWTPRLGLLIDELRKQTSVLRLSYLADVESSGLVDERMAELKERIRKRWEQVSEDELVIEAEVFWRHGGPVDKKLNISDSKGTADYISTIFDRENFGEDTERQLPYGYTYMPWMQDPEQFKKDDEAKFEVKQVAEKKYTTKKLKGLVPPILFKSGKADISEEFVGKLREILRGMRDRVNVRLHFIGHTDDVKLRGVLKQQYEDNMGLSKERAGTTAEFFQRALELPPEAISYEGMGETKPVASNNSTAGRGQNRRVEVQVWYDEVDEELVDRKFELDQEIKRIMVCRVETVCKLRYKEGHSRKAKLKNLVPPFHYDEGVSEIPVIYLQQLKQALQNLASKDNVQMRFIAYTDNIPLTGRDERIYGDHVGLSKANARRVAIAVQEALGLSNAAINSTGRGGTSPIASNNSEKGRALNRRIEVEFWHDDPLEDLPEDPQICPEADAAETVERIYNPPEGDIKPVYYENGKAVIPDGYTKALQRAMEDISDKGNVRLRFIGYTSNKRLSRRTAMVYGDDIGLSTARARRAMESIKQQMGLTDEQAEFEGRGYVQSHDVVNTGFVELDRSKVEVQVVYDELAVLDEMEGVSIKRLIRDVETKNPFALNLMRISVDGQPVNDPNKNIPDVQRCTDVALDKAQVRFKFDNLQGKPRLNVTAWPNVISHFDSADTEFVENLTHFKLYSNYPWTIDKAEVRLFETEQSTRDTPVAVIPVNEQGRAQWQYNLENYSAPRMQLKYVLRVYDKQGNFDETAEQTMWIVDSLKVDNSERDVARELLIGYGENRLAVNNINHHGGAVKVYGEQVPEGHKVWFAGRELPVNDSGEFGGEFIIPSGLHTVEVSITDQAGNGHVYQRDLELENSDWFYVGIVDLTASIDTTNGSAQQITGDDTRYNNELSLDGRLAFYVKGKFANESVLTASTDTREGPVDELFSNFMNKSPDALFRRIDPDYYYPTFGDDSTVEEGAPTSGKFYLKYQKDKNYGLWGNFNIAYLDNNLAHVDRGLYGANVNYESDSATSFGEKRYAVNLFAAEPGTVAGRDEFLGTSGSFYYLRRQDILIGSERLRVEIRDAVSGMVIGVKNLTHGLDYDIDYIQGRIMLTQPLSATA